MIKAIDSGSSALFNQPSKPVDLGVINELTAAHSELSLVSSTIARFKMYILRSGIEIKARGSKTYTFDMGNTNDRVLYEQELYPAIVQMVHEWLLYGFTCVSVAPSQLVDGALTLVVLPLEKLTVTMTLNECFQREYDVQLADGTATSIKTKHVIDTAQFLCMTPPDIDGKPMSSVALALPELHQYKKLWDDYILVSHRLVRPVPMFKQLVDPLATLPAGTASRGVTRMLSQESAAVAGMGSEPTSRVFHNAEERRNQMTREQLREAKSRRGELPTEDKRFGDPLDRPYIEPAGQSLEPGLRFDTPAELAPMINAIEQKFMRSMGLPSDENVYATTNSVEMYMKLLNMSIISFHKRASQLLGRALAPVLGKRIFQDIVDEDTRMGLEKIAEDDTEELDNELLKEKLQDVVSNTEVVVQFSTNPITTFDLLDKYYQADIIPFEQFVLHALDLASMQQWSDKGTYFSEKQRSELEFQERLRASASSAPGTQTKKARTE